MYQISVKSHFDAAHSLRGYGGRCEAMHGHRFEVELSVESGELNDTGLAYDFTELKRHLAEVLGRFDHICLNEIPPFDRINPSSENIARTIYEELVGQLRGVKISRVEVWESPSPEVPSTRIRSYNPYRKSPPPSSSARDECNPVKGRSPSWNRGPLSGFPSDFQFPEMIPCKDHPPS